MAFKDAGDRKGPAVSREDGLKQQHPVASGVLAQDDRPWPGVGPGARDNGAGEDTAGARRKPQPHANSASDAGRPRETGPNPARVTRPPLSSREDPVYLKSQTVKKEAFAPRQIHSWFSVSM